MTTWTCPRCRRPIEHWSAIVNTDEGFAHKTCRAFDVTGAIIAYESGDMDHDGMIELFQHLIDTGLVWSLQGHYGRTAESMIEMGYCHG